MVVEPLSVLVIFVTKAELLHFGLEGFSANLEEFCGTRDISFGFFEGLGNQLALHLSGLHTYNVFEGGVLELGHEGYFVHRQWGGGGRGAHVFGEVREAELGSFRQDEDALHEVFELSDIAGPGPILEHGQSLEAEVFHIFMEAVVVFFNEVVDEAWDIVLAFAQGGEVDGDDVEAIEQVLAEASGFHFFFKVSVAGGDKAHIHACGFNTSDALKRALLEGAQEFHLHFHGYFRNFVQEEGSSLRQLKAARFRVDSTRKGAAFIAEELRLHQVLGDGGAINFNKGLGVAGGALVEGRSDQLLARPGLSRNKDS